MLAGVDDFPRDDAVFQNARFVIDILEKQIERGEALCEAAFNDVPFRAGDDTRQQVMRENSFGAFFAAIDGESNALVEKREVGFELAAAKFLGGK